MRDNATFSFCAVCVRFCTTFYTSRPGSPLTPQELRPHGNFILISAVLSNAPQILPQWGGPGGDEARPGITKCLKLLLTQTAQDKPFYLFLSRVFN